MKRVDDTAMTVSEQLAHTTENAQKEPDLSHISTRLLRRVDSEISTDQKFKLLCITWKSTVIQSSLCHGNPIKALEQGERIGHEFVLYSHLRQKTKPMNPGPTSSAIGLVTVIATEWLIDKAALQSLSCAKIVG